MTDDQPVEATGRRWLVWTAAIVGVLAVAIAGIFVGRLSVTGPVAPTQVAEGSDPGAEQVPVGRSAGVDEAGSPVVLVAADATDAPTVVLTPAVDLPDSATSATGFRVTGDGISPGQVAGVLAGVLGATGTPTQVDGMWTVGSAGGPQLVVHSDPLVRWEFTGGPRAASGTEAPSPDPMSSAAATSSVTPSPGADPTSSPAPGPTSSATSSGSDGAALDPSTAVELATTLLSRIGVDTAAVDWQVDRRDADVIVTAWQLVDRARTSLSWQVGFDPTGAIVSASGFSAGLHQVPNYPVVGARTAIDRLAQAGWGALAPRRISAGSPADGPVDATSAATPSGAPGAASGGPSAAAASVPSAVAASGAATAPDKPRLAVPVATVTVDAADLGIAQYWQDDGTLMILPAYVMTGSDGSKWSVLAVDGEYVEFVDPAADTAVR